MSARWVAIKRMWFTEVGDVLCATEGEAKRQLSLITAGLTPPLGQRKRHTMTSWPEGYWVVCKEEADPEWGPVCP